MFPEEIKTEIVRILGQDLSHGEKQEALGALFKTHNLPPHIIVIGDRIHQEDLHRLQELSLGMPHIFVLERHEPTPSLEEHMNELAQTLKKQIPLLAPAKTLSGSSRRQSKKKHQAPRQENEPFYAPFLK